MKKIFIILLNVVFFSGLFYAVYHGASQRENTTGGNMFILKTEKENVVICTGKYAKRYHKERTCDGLDACKSEVINITLTEAESRGLEQCRLCSEY